MLKESLILNRYSGITHNFMGKTLEKKGDFENAESSYINAIKSEPENANHYNDLAKLLRKKGFSESSKLITLVYEAMNEIQNREGKLSEKEEKVILEAA